MKKFSKILTLVLSLVLIVTAFTVVSLAADTPVPVEKTPAKYGTFDGANVGDILSYDRSAQGIVQVQDNGNKYVLVKDIPNNDTANPQWDIGPSVNKDFNIVAYPYFMIDFDIMTINGSYAGHSYNPRLYYAKVGGALASSSNFVGSTSFTSLGEIELSTIPYDWNHLSIVVEYKGSGKFVLHRYVNGELSSSTESSDFSNSAAFTSGASGEASVVIGSMKLYPSTSAEVGMDNMRLTYFPAGYLDGDVAAMANHYFKNGEGYEFPYKRTIATVTDNETGEVSYFDNLEEAYAAVNENNTFKLLVAAEVKDSNGTLSYYTEEEFSGIFGKATAGSTIKLLKDIITTETNITHIDKDGVTTVYDGAYAVTKNLTLDLNGFQFGSLVTKITQYEATLGENGEYVKGAALGEQVTTGKGGALFYQTKNGITFTITSSRPGAVVSCLTVTADQWVYNEEVVKAETTEVSSRTLFSLYPSNSNYVIDGKNITFYTNTIFYAEHGGNNASLSVNIDGGTFYIIGKSGDGALALRRGGNHTVKNATFYSNSDAPIIKSGWDKNTTITFDNCNLYNGSIYGLGTTNTYYFNNCRIATGIADKSTATIILGDKTVTISDLTAESENHTAATLAGDALNLNSVSKKSYYNNVTASQLLFDPVTLVFTGVSKNVASVTFVYEVGAVDTAKATVTWKAPDGEILAITEETKNTLAFAPKVYWTNGYRAVVNAIWSDAEGNLSDLMLGDADSYEFTATLPSEDDAWFVAGINGVMMNMTYYAHFAYNLYFPVEEGVEVQVWSGSAQAYKPLTDIVSIYGKKYYVTKGGYPNSTNALNDETSKVAYIVDGVKYETTIKVNTLMYAEIAMLDPNTTEIEKEAIACLIRYIEESYKYQATLDGSDLYTANQATFESFYTDYRAPAAYTTEYRDGEVHPLDEEKTAAVFGLIEEVHFKVMDSRVTFAVTLTDEAVSAGYKIFFAGISYSNEKNTEDGKIFYTDNKPLHSYLMAKSYTITVQDAEGNTVSRDLDNDGTPETDAVMTYSLATYITEMENAGNNVDLAKALYALGIAVIDVRNSIY